MSIARLVPVALLGALALAFGSAFAGAPPPDTDGDGAPDALDNCVESANADQCDTDADGYGNVCDADFNNDGFVGGPDYNVLRTEFLQAVPPGDPDVDLTCDGAIGNPDFNIFRARYGGFPGPSGLACAGTPPCRSNDTCTSAQPVGSVQAFDESTAGQTTDGAASCGDSNASPDDYWLFTAPADGLMAVHTCEADFDTVVSIHSTTCPSGPGNELACNDDDEGVCGLGSTGSFVSLMLLEGEQVVVRVAGNAGASGDYTIAFGPADGVPPSPDPMTFDDVSAGLSQISLTATTAFSAEPPVEYLFEAVSGQPEADDSGWQLPTSFTDTGLEPNEQYQYTVTARDVSFDETAPSAVASVFTMAHFANAPAFFQLSDTSLVVIFDSFAGLNPPITEYAVQCSSSPDGVWDGQYVAAPGPTGTPGGTDESLATWKTEADWEATTVTGLLPDTQYCFRVRARNGDLVTTAFSPETCTTTLP